MVTKAEKRAARRAAQSAAPQQPKDDTANTTPPAEKQQSVTRRVGTVKVLKTDAKFRGARDAWYAKLKEYDGKPIADYEAECTKTPPSLPKSGKAEKPAGWIGYFVRTGILSIVQPSK